jgi:hypothetical protein
MSRADDDPVGKVSIDDLTVGRTIWFVNSVESGVRTASESDLHTPFIYSGEIIDVEEMAMSKAGAVVNREMAIKFKGGDDWGMTFYVGEREYWNSRIYLTHEDALAEAERWVKNAVEEMQTEYDAAVKALTHAREQVGKPIIEANYTVGSQSGNYLTTLQARIEADARGESITGVY